MGIIKKVDHISINRPKVYILCYRDYSEVNRDGGHRFILGYFTSEERVNNFVKQLVEQRVLIPVKVGTNKFGDDLIRYVKINQVSEYPDIRTSINLIIEYHEMDLDYGEISYYGVTYPKGIKPEIELLDRP